MPRLKLRNKLLLFSLILALIPIGVAGWTLIRITQDELKTFTNGEIVLTAELSEAGMAQLGQGLSAGDAELGTLKLVIDGSKLSTLTLSNCVVTPPSPSSTNRSTRNGFL